MISLSKPNVGEEEYEAVRKVLESGWWTTGEVTEQLEEEFAEYKGAKHAIGVSSCTAALHLSLRCLIPQDRPMCMVTTPLTFCSTINSILYAGGYPELVDVDVRTQCLDVYGLERVRIINGVVPVHFAGFPCRMDYFMDVAEKRGFFVVEDCAHAVETKYNGRHVGTFGQTGCFSFNPIKNVAAPEMGMVVTDDDQIAERIRRLRLHGMSASTSDRVSKPGQYDIMDLGYKYNCTDVEAVIALCQLRKVHENWIKRKWIFDKYDDAFLGFNSEGIFNGGVHPDCSDHGLHLYTIRLNNRDRFVQEMNRMGIYCGIHYRPIHLHPYYQRRFGWRRGMFPNAEYIGDHICSLPLGPGMIEAEVGRVIEGAHQVLRRGDYCFGKS